MAAFVVLAGPSVATILALRWRFIAFAAFAAALRSGRIDQDSAEIVDIRQGRAGDHLIVQRGEEAMSVVVAEPRLRTHPDRRGAGERVWCDDGAGDLLRAVD